MGGETYKIYLESGRVRYVEFFRYISNEKSDTVVTTVWMEDAEKVVIVRFDRNVNDANDAICTGVHSECSPGIFLSLPERGFSLDCLTFGGFKNSENILSTEDVDEFREKLKQADEYTLCAAYERFANGSVSEIYAGLVEAMDAAQVFEMKQSQVLKVHLPRRMRSTLTT